MGFILVIPPVSRDELPEGNGNNISATTTKRSSSVSRDELPEGNGNIFCPGFDFDEKELSLEMNFPKGTETRQTRRCGRVAFAASSLETNFPKGTEAQEFLFDPESRSELRL